jgi:hypothetical protein
VLAKRSYAPVQSGKKPAGRLTRVPELRRYFNALLVDRVGSNLTLHTDFEFDPRERVEQIDNEAAWSSPVWVNYKQDTDDSTASLAASGFETPVAIIGAGILALLFGIRRRQSRRQSCRRLAFGP